MTWMQHPAGLWSRDRFTPDPLEPQRKIFSVFHQCYWYVWSDAALGLGYSCHNTYRSAGFLPHKEKKNGSFNKAFILWQIEACRSSVPLLRLTREDSLHWGITLPGWISGPKAARQAPQLCGGTRSLERTMCKLRGGSETLTHPQQEDTRALACSVLRSTLLAGIMRPTKVVFSGGGARGFVLTQKAAVAVCSSSGHLGPSLVPTTGDTERGKDSAVPGKV